MRWTMSVFVLCLAGFAGCNSKSSTEPALIEQEATANLKSLPDPTPPETPGPATVEPVGPVEEPAAPAKPDIPPIPLAAEPTAGPSDWATFLGPNCDSKSPEKGILTDWFNSPPKLVWQRKLGISYGIGSVANGRLFQFDRHGDQARLTVLDARTGEEQWTFEYPTDYSDLYNYNGGPRCSPIIDGDRVYLFGAEGMLHCLRIHPDRGEVLWKLDTTKEFGVVQNFFGVGSTPVIAGDLLIAMIGGSPEESQAAPPGALDFVKPNGTGIVAFDKLTGAIKYKIADELASYASLKLATIGERRWCFAFCRRGLLGFEPASGTIDFHYPWRARILESVNASTPVVVGNEVLISETYGPGATLLRVAPGAHQIVWNDSPTRREKSLQTHWNTAVYVDGYVYASSGRHTENAELRCVEWKTGKVCWSVPKLTRTSLMYVDGHLLSLGEFGSLHLFKPNPERFDVLCEAEVREPGGVVARKFTGVLQGSTDENENDGPSLLKYPCWAAPILSHGLLYLRGKDRLVCLELIPKS